MIAPVAEVGRQAELGRYPRCHEAGVHARGLTSRRIGREVRRVEHFIRGTRYVELAVLNIASEVDATLILCFPWLMETMSP